MIHKGRGLGSDGCLHIASIGMVVMTVGALL